MSEGLHVGTVTIGPDVTVTEQFEVAAWSRTHAVTPGTYDVVAYEEAGGSPYLRLSASVDTTVVYAYTPALFCGVPLGGQPQGTDHSDVGQAGQRPYRVELEHVALDPDAAERVACMWVESPRAAHFEGFGLEVARHKVLVRPGRAWGCRYRLDPADGSLPEFISSAALLCERVNALQADGLDPDVWEVTYGEDRKPWFEAPLEEHRPYSQRKHRLDYADARKHWRYYH